MFHIEKTEYQLGAYIRGLDLTKPMSDEDFSSLFRALSENEVLFFRDQNITHADHRRIASAFGSMQTHPAYPTVEGFPEITILENDEKNLKLDSMILLIKCGRLLNIFKKSIFRN